MRIAGIYPQKFGTDFKIQHAVSEPYGLEMILAVAKEQGCDVELFLPLEEKKNSVVQISEEELLEKIADFKPDIAAFSLYTCQYPSGKRIAYELKRRNQKIINVAGNRYPSFLKFAEEPFDFFVMKEGEETFNELLKEIQGRQDYENVKGISFKKDDKAIFTGFRERNSNLDLLPDALRFPVILKQVYRGVSIPPLTENPNYAIVEYSRCCYNACNFCDNSGFWGNKVVFRSKERVVDEMFKLKEKGADIFYFMDLNFTSSLEKARELCEEMLRRKLDASWYCMSNTLTLDREKGSELLKIMKKAGCFKIAFGIESTNDNALERMNKKAGGNFTTNNSTIRVLEKSLEAGILNQGFYIIGFPWETEKSIIRDAEALNLLPIHLLNLGIFTPIPLSRFYDDMLKEGYNFDSVLEKHDRNTLIYNHKTLTNESIKKLQKKIYDNFYASSSYKERIRRSCEIEPRFRQAFSDYFSFTGKKVRA